MDFIDTCNAALFHSGSSPSSVKCLFFFLRIDLQFNFGLIEIYFDNLFALSFEAPATITPNEEENRTDIYSRIIQLNPLDTQLHRLRSIG